MTKGITHPFRNDSTHSQTSIDYEHHEVHEGDHFLYADGVTLNSSASQVYLITTPNTTKYCHLVLSFASGLGATFVLYEGSDRTGTAAQTIYNCNRNSATTATTTVHKGVSGGSTDGTVIRTYYLGSASTGVRAGGLGRGLEEIVLKKNTKYQFTATSQANSNNIFVELSWYEHTDLS